LTNGADAYGKDPAERRNARAQPQVGGRATEFAADLFTVHAASLDDPSVLGLFRA